MLVVDPNDIVIAAAITELAREQGLDGEAIPEEDLETLDAIGTDLFAAGGRAALARWMYGLEASAGVALLRYALGHPIGNAVIQLREFNHERDLLDRDRALGRVA